MLQKRLSAAAAAAAASGGASGGSGQGGAVVAAAAAAGAPSFPQHGGLIGIESTSPDVGGGKYYTSTRDNTNGILLTKTSEDVLTVSRAAEEKAASPERLNLDNMSLEKCPVLEGEQSLRLLNYQNNLISRIDNLRSLPNLIFLDMYNNKIESLEGDTLPATTTLRVLMVGKNQIKSVSNLEKLVRLDVLDLHSNRIQQLQGLESLTDLRVLNLAGNNLRVVEKIRFLQGLTELNLRRNKIERVAEIDHLPKLQRLFLSNNRISTYESCACLFGGGISSLLELSLDGNPLAQQRGSHGGGNSGSGIGGAARYRVEVLASLPSLGHLDLKRVTEEERSAAQHWKNGQKAADEGDKESLERGPESGGASHFPAARGEENKSSDGLFKRKEGKEGGDRREDDGGRPVAGPPSGEFPPPFRATPGAAGGRSSSACAVAGAATDAEAGQQTPRESWDTSGSGGVVLVKVDRSNQQDDEAVNESGDSSSLKRKDDVGMMPQSAPASGAAAAAAAAARGRGRASPGATVSSSSSSSSVASRGSRGAEGAGAARRGGGEGRRGSEAGRVSASSGGAGREGSNGSEGGSTGSRRISKSEAAGIGESKPGGGSSSSSSSSSSRSGGGGGGGGNGDRGGAPHGRRESEMRIKRVMAERKVAIDAAISAWEHRMEGLGGTAEGGEQQQNGEQQGQGQGQSQSQSQGQGQGQRELQQRPRSKAGAGASASGRSRRRASEGNGSSSSGSGSSTAKASKLNVAGYFELEQRPPAPPAPSARSEEGGAGSSRPERDGILLKAGGMTLRVYGNVWRWMDDPKVASLAGHVVDASLNYVHVRDILPRAEAISHIFPNLVSLCLSSNDIASLRQLGDLGPMLPRIKALNIVSNPVILAVSPPVLEAWLGLFCPQLQLLNGSPVAPGLKTRALSRFSGMLKQRSHSLEASWGKVVLPPDFDTLGFATGVMARKAAVAGAADASAAAAGGSRGGGGGADGGGDSAAAAAEGGGQEGLAAAAAAAAAAKSEQDLCARLWKASRGETSAPPRLTAEWVGAQRQADKSYRKLQAGVRDAHTQEERAASALREVLRKLIKQTLAAGRED